MPLSPTSRALSFLLALFLLALSVTTAAADTSYVIQPGDTLASISRRFNVSIDALVQANRLVD